MSRCSLTVSYTHLDVYKRQAYLCLFQPFISLWMGSDRLLPLGFVLVFSLNDYVGWHHRMLGSYRAVLGNFEQDQWFMVASAATNLILRFAPVSYTHLGTATRHYRAFWQRRCRAAAAEAVLKP